MLPHKYYSVRYAIAYELKVAPKRQRKDGTPPLSVYK